MSTTTPNAPTRSTAWLWGLLFVLSGNMLIDALEVSVAVVALPSIGAELGFPVSALHWTVSGFALGFGGCLLLGGRVVALLGRRRVYLAALLGFAAVSLLGAMVDDAALLVATRFVKGLCVALTAPTGLAIISGTFAEGPARNRAISVYSLFGASGFSVGLLLSGLLTGISWRWTFLFPAPVALALFVAGLWLIPRDESARSGPRRYDAAGAVTFIGAAMLLPYAITSGSQMGWDHPRALGALSLAAALAGVFVLVERSTAEPLLLLGVLARRPLVRSMLGAAALNGSYWGFLYVVTLHLQGPAGWSPLQTGLAILPASLLLALAVPFSGRLIGRVGAARLIAFGAAVPPVGYALYYLAAGPAPAYDTIVLPAMLLVGFGFALGFSALHVQAVTGAAPDEQGMVSGVYQTAVQIGGAIVLAVTAALLAGRMPAAGASAAELVAAQRPAVAMITAVGVVGWLVALIGLIPVSRAARDNTQSGADERAGK
jgi:MFS family permease